MKKYNIRILIGLMGLALIGLIAVQISLIKDNVDWKKSQFERSVNNVLANVSYKLERQENLAKMKRSRAGQRLFQKIDSIHRSSVKHLPSSGFNDTIIIQTENGNFLFSSDVNYGGTSADLFTFDVDINSTKNPYEELAHVNQYTSDISLLLEEMISGMVSFDPFESITKRVDSDNLDSLLREELKIWGITTEYEYTVVDIIDRPLFTSTNSFTKKKSIERNPFSVQLFTNEILENPHFLKVNFPNETGYLFSTILPFLAITIVFLMLIIGGFYYTINTILKQKKVSEIKNDFISNMTHELKTPISTISLACEALVDPDMQKNDKSRTKFVGMINEENKRLGVLVESVLKTAVLDKGKMKFKPEQLNIHELLSQVIRNFELQLDNVKGTIETKFNARTEMINADKIHLTNVFYNLIDNAIKYTKKTPEIVIRTFNDEKGLYIEFIDNGIGISKDEQKKIFDQLYRVPKGNLHDVKGYGLGLHYVKVILEKHLGEIFVASTVGKGSTFTLLLPTS